MRYGQNISESGVGGMTTGVVGGSANQGERGRGGDGEAKESRREQGYGPGSGVGA